MSGYYEWWHVEILVFVALASGLRIGFLLGRERRLDYPPPLNTARAGHPEPPLTPDVRTRLATLGKQIGTTSVIQRRPSVVPGSDT